MDITTFAEGLQNRLTEFESTESTTDLTQTGKVLSFVHQLLHELKTFTLTYTFQGAVEEIHFFKNTKPVLLSQYYYYKRKFAIQVFDAFRDRKSRLENYNKTLRKMQTYILSNRDFYEYCISGNSYLDNAYFKRSAVPTVLAINHDQQFATGFDIKLSKILANEMIKSYVQDCIRTLQKDNSTSAQSSLTWTAPKTDLVELIYALHEVGAFNNSTSDVRRIVETMEALFNVNLGNYYRTFLGIRMRKTGQTAFLDQLKGRLMQRMSEMEGK
ncbi:RteC domain-containing protein [Chryseolinea soli]|nr:RteC domain-containing protein [Chryseolinea soli]